MLYLMLLFLLAVSNYKGTWATPCVTLNDGYNMPTLGYGTAVALAQLPLVRDAVFFAIVKANYRMINTAALYGTEVMIGQAIADAICGGYVKRQDLFITTKLWNSNHAREQVVPALKRSLLRLGLEYVDLFLIHSPVAEDNDGNIIDIDYVETWQGMQDARELGLTTSIGISNFNTSEITRLIKYCDVIPAVHEIEVNPTFTNDRLVSFCQQLGITVEAYSPLGYLPPRFIPDPPPPRFNNPILLKIAKKYNKLTSQVVLRYGLDRGLIVLSKSVTIPHIMSNINIFDFSLDEKEITAISSFNENVRVVTLPVTSETIMAYYATAYNELNVTIPFDNV